MDDVMFMHLSSQPQWVQRKSESAICVHNQSAWCPCSGSYSRLTSTSHNRFASVHLAVGL